MKSKLLILLLAIFNICDCEKKLIIVEDFEGLNNDYLSEEVYEETDKLLVYCRGYEPSKKHTEKVEINFLDRFPNFEEFIIESCSFGTIEKIASGEKIKILNAQGNRIRALSEGCLVNLENLEDLFMNDNEITTLPGNLLRNNKKLKKIHFYNNQITEIPPTFFWGLKEVIDINFRENQIEYLPGSIFKDNKKLKEVHFETNKIYKIHPDILKGLNDLSKYWFHDNPCVPDGGNADRAYELNSKLDGCYEIWRETTSSQEVDYDHYSAKSKTFSPHKDEHLEVSIQEKKLTTNYWMILLVGLVLICLVAIVFVLCRRRSINKKQTNEKELEELMSTENQSNIINK